MKVKDIIEILGRFDQEESVVWWDDEVMDYQDCKLENIKERIMWKSGPDDYLDEWQMSREINKNRNLKSEKVLVIQEN